MLYYNSYLRKEISRCGIKNFISGYRKINSQIRNKYLRIQIINPAINNSNSVNKNLVSAIRNINSGKRNINSRNKN